MSASHSHGAGVLAPQPKGARFHRSRGRFHPQHDQLDILTGQASPSPLPQGTAFHRVRGEFHPRRVQLDTPPGQAQTHPNTRDHIPQGGRGPSSSEPLPFPTRTAPHSRGAGPQAPNPKGPDSTGAGGDSTLNATSSTFSRGGLPQAPLHKEPYSTGCGGNSTLDASSSTLPRGRHKRPKHPQTQGSTFHMGEAVELRTLRLTPLAVTTERGTRTEGAWFPRNRKIEKVGNSSVWWVPEVGRG